MNVEVDTTGWSPLTTDYCMLMFQCYRRGCYYLRTNLKSGIIGEICSLEICLSVQLISAFTFSVILNRENATVF